MSDSTKTLIGGVAALAALVIVFGLMADCSKHVADVESDPKVACLEAHGTWSQPAPNHVGYCVWDDPQRPVR